MHIFFFVIVLDKPFSFLIRLFFLIKIQSLGPIVFIFVNELLLFLFTKIALGMKQCTDRRVLDVDRRNEMWSEISDEAFSKMRELTGDIVNRCVLL